MTLDRQLLGFANESTAWCPANSFSRATIGD
jgi:hypothetical protein